VFFFPFSFPFLLFIHPFRQFCKCFCLFFVFYFVGWLFLFILFVWSGVWARRTVERWGKNGVSLRFSSFFLSFFSLSPTLMQARGFFLYLVWEFFVCALDRSFLSALYSLLSFLLFPFSPSLSLFFFACGVGRTDGGDGDGDGGDGRGENVIKWSVAWVG